LWESGHAESRHYNERKALSARRSQAIT